MNVNDPIKVEIHPISTLTDNYVWALIDPATKNTIIVDPGVAAPVIAFLQQRGLSLVGILVTHHHWDHTNGVLELKNLFQVPVVAPANEQVTGMTIPAHEHDVIRFDHFPLSFAVLDIPGHTKGHVAYYSPGMLFCGDTLFAAGCGRLFEGTAEQMVASLNKMAALPDETRVYCAHEYTLKNLSFASLVEPGNTMIAERIKSVSSLRNKNLPSLPSLLHEEKQTNPFLRCSEQEVAKNASKHTNHLLETALDVFISLRKMKDQF